MLNGGQNGINYDFCEHLPSSVSGHVYHDANNNGVRENGETPIPGTTVILLDAGGTQIATTTTDSNGFYKFANLPAGTYSIHEVQPDGWIDGKDAAGTILGQVVGTAQNPGDQHHRRDAAVGRRRHQLRLRRASARQHHGHVHEDPDGRLLQR